MFNWYAKLRAQAEESNPEPSPIEKLLLKKEIPTEVFSEEFEWEPCRRYTRYSQFSTDRREVIDVPIILTGRWKIIEHEGGTTDLKLEVREEKLIKNPSYLSGNGGIEVKTYWLDESHIEIQSLPKETINNCRGK